MTGTTRARALGLMLAVAVSATLSAQREWRDYSGGPDSSRLRRVDANHQGQRRPAGGRPGAYASGLTDFNPLVVRGVVYGRGPEQLVRRARRGHRQAAVDAPAVRRLQRPRRELLGEQRRQGAPADLQLQQPAAGARRRHRRERRPRSARTAASTCASASIAIPRPSASRSRTPGRVFENLIILGSATNQEYASAPGDIRAFDVRTGKLVWTFHTVPRPGEFGYDTWPKDAWKTDRRREQLGRAVDRREARHRLRSDRQPEVQLLRRQPPRRQPVRRLPASRSMRRPASGSGTSRPCTTTSGTSTTTRRRS